MTAGPPAGVGGDASRRSERLIIRAFALIRAFTLAQAAVALSIDWPRYRWPGLMAGLLVAAAADLGRPGPSGPGRARRAYLLGWGTLQCTFGFTPT